MIGLMLMALFTVDAEESASFCQFDSSVWILMNPEIMKID